MPSDQAPLLLGIQWTLMTVATLFVAMRYFCRIRYRVKLWWDDCWIGISLLFSWAMSINWTVYAQLGGTAYAPLTPEGQVNVTRLNWVSQVWCIISLMAGKIAVAALILRLSAPSKWRQNLLWGLCIIELVLGWLDIITVFVQCRPMDKLWDPEGHPEGSCWSPSVLVNIGLVCGSYFAFLDIVLALIPVHMIWNLNMPLKRKIAICCLLSTGIFAAAMAIVKTSMIPADLHRDTDFVRTTVLLFVWNACEVNVVIIASCIPTILPIIERLGGRDPSRSSTASSQAPRVNGGSQSIFGRHGASAAPSWSRNQDTLGSLDAGRFAGGRSQEWSVHPSANASASASASYRLSPTTSVDDHLLKPPNSRYPVHA